MDNLISNKKKEVKTLKFLLTFTLILSLAISLFIIFATEFSFIWILFVLPAFSILLIWGFFNIATGRVFCAKYVFQGVGALLSNAGDAWAYLWGPFILLAMASPAIFLVSPILLSPIDYFVITKKEGKSK